MRTRTRRGPSAALAVVLVLALAAVIAAVLAVRSPAAGNSSAADGSGDGPHPAAPAETSGASPWHAGPAGPATIVPAPAKVTAYLAGRTGTVLAAVYDVRDGREWTTGNGPAQATASVVKLDILEALLAGKPRGLSGSDRTLASSMITKSDNDAATRLWYAAGGPSGLRAFNDAAGLTGTVPSSCVACAGFAWPGWGLTTTTPADQILLLRQLAGGRLLTSSARGYLLSLMRHVEPAQRWGITGGVPAGVPVALKDGWLPLDTASTDWQVNSEGWVSGDGRDYLVAVLTTGNPTETYGIATITHLSALVWQSM